MTTLRTNEGINVNYVVQHFGEQNKKQLIKAAQKFIMSGRLILQNENLQLTNEGKFFADGIAGDLFA